METVECLIAAIKEQLHEVSHVRAKIKYLEETIEQLNAGLGLLKGFVMDNDLKDFVFLEHFNDKREPEIIKMKSCPFCNSNTTVVMREKPGFRCCLRCGKVFEDKNET